MSLANFVIVDPYGNATSHSGPAELALGYSGQDTLVFNTVGYRFGFGDFARGLHPGQYSTAVDASVGMTNDPSCGTEGPTDGTFEIDQAAYDSSGVLTTFGVQFDFTCASGTRVFGTIAYQLANTTPNQGYYLFDQSGALVGFGNDDYLPYLGDPALLALNAVIVAMVPTADGNGYWMIAKDGGVFAFGDAAFYGSMGAKPLNAPIVGAAVTHDGAGYWLVAADGGVFAFGDAAFYGSMGARPLNAPIVGAVATHDGAGYWLVAADGGVFTFGDAAFYGSTGHLRLSKPVVGMTPTSDGKGYWFVATDGGIFAFGDAAFFGSLGGTGATTAAGMAI